MFARYRSSDADALHRNDTVFTQYYFRRERRPSSAWRSGGYRKPETHREPCPCPCPISLLPLNEWSSNSNSIFCSIEVVLRMNRTPSEVRCWIASAHLKKAKCQRAAVPGAEDRWAAPSNYLISSLAGAGSHPFGCHEACRSARADTSQRENRRNRAPAASTTGRDAGRLGSLTPKLSSCRRLSSLGRK